jgi:hypothetical protein
VPAWNCGCARTGQLTARRATRATRATHLIPTALGSPPVRRTVASGQTSFGLAIAMAGWGA